MAGEKINLDYITEYLHKLLPESTEELQLLEKYALDNEVPIIHREVKALLEVLCLLKKPLKILEIGTAIGYSASVMALSSPEDVKITSIEREPEMTKLALDNITKLQLEEKIRVIEGDALEVLPLLSSKYDIVFMDAAKGYYNEFFDSVINLINDGGLLICDNVLYKGMTATDDLVKRRQKTIVGRMREFLEMLCNHSKLTTSVIPIGDGVTISYYQEVGKSEKT